MENALPKQKPESPLSGIRMISEKQGRLSTFGANCSGLCPAQAFLLQAAQRSPGPGRDRAGHGRGQSQVLRQDSPQGRVSLREPSRAEELGARVGDWSEPLTLSNKVRGNHDNLVYF